MTDEGVRSLIEQLRTALNRHDLDTFLDSFDKVYESEQPAMLQPCEARAALVVRALGNSDRAIVVGASPDSSASYANGGSLVLRRPTQAGGDLSP